MINECVNDKKYSGRLRTQICIICKYKDVRIPNDLGYNINGDCRIDKTVKIYKDIRNAVNNN